MLRSSYGYTIVEVMIVLAITAILFVGAVIAFQGDQGQVGFNQTMQDLSSKIQYYVNEVSTANYPGLENYSCSTGSGYPQLTAGGGFDQDCIKIGQAIQVQPGTGNINIYKVLGDSTIQNGGSSLGTQTPTSLIQADPHPAMDQNGIIPGLIDSYTLEDGATVLSSLVTPIGGSQLAGNYNLVGIYNNLASASGQSSSNAPMSLVAAPIPGTSLYDVEECIEGDGDAPPCTFVNPTEIFSVSQWTLCIQDNNKTAQLMTYATTNGITTRLNFDTCT